PGLRLALPLLPVPTCPCTAPPTRPRPVQSSQNPGLSRTATLPPRTNTEANAPWTGRRGQFDQVNPLVLTAPPRGPSPSAWAGPANAKPATAMSAATSKALTLVLESIGHLRSGIPGHRTYTHLSR